jgi:hypothetical protein
MSHGIMNSPLSSSCHRSVYHAGSSAAIKSQEFLAKSAKFAKGRMGLSDGVATLIRQFHFLSLRALGSQRENFPFRATNNCRRSGDGTSLLVVIVDLIHKVTGAFHDYSILAI